jgi:hypothetical protein
MVVREKTEKTASVACHCAGEGLSPPPPKATFKFSLEGLTRLDVPCPLWSTVYVPIHSGNRNRGQTYLYQVITW